MPKSLCFIFIPYIYLFEKKLYKAIFNLNIALSSPVGVTFYCTSLIIIFTRN